MMRSGVRRAASGFCIEGAVSVLACPSVDGEFGLHDLKDGEAKPLELRFEVTKPQAPEKSGAIWVLDRNHDAIYPYTL